MAFLHNSWYVASFSRELGAEPAARRLLDQSIVLYRDGTGAAAALADRCVHRFAPLHKGKVVDGCIECPYHGLRFDVHGACVHNPHGDGKIPKAAKVRPYPVQERDGLVWVWMGTPELAASQPVMDLGAFLAPQTPELQGSFHVRANYQLIIDNLLDLGHVPYLHPTTLADPSQAGRQRTEMAQQGDDVWNCQWLDATVPMIEAIAQAMGTTDLMSLSPVMLPGDAAGVRARRILEALIQKERVLQPAAAPV